MSKVSITRSLLDDLAMSISAKSGEPVPLTLTEMKDAVDGIQTGGGHLTQDQDGFLVIPPDGSGGGSSDFSTAQVTFICNASNDVDVYFAAIEEASLPFVPIAHSYGGYQLSEGDEIVANAVLYKGVCFCSFANANTINGSGDVVVTDNTVATITGDCTITIS